MTNNNISIDLTDFWLKWNFNYLIHDWILQLNKLVAKIITEKVSQIKTFTPQ